MSQNLLLADPQALALESLTSKDRQVVLVVKTIKSVALCPKCHQPSSRIHSRYQRTVADLPCLGVSVQLQLLTRRFFCINKTCVRRIFCERLPRVVAAYGRQTVRLNDILHLIGMMLVLLGVNLVRVERMRLTEPLMPCQPLTITLSNTDQQDLEKLANRPSTPQQTAQRARIVLKAALGQNNGEIARTLDVSIKMVRQWRRRWIETTDQSKTVMERLLDSARPGAPLKFTPEQQVECMAMACRDPMEYGRPISHWSAHELADELIKQGIVEQISPRQVGRWLAEAELKPHSSHYWLFPPHDPEFEVKVEDISQHYLSAPIRAQQGERTISLALMK